jgi:hypothetical protein
MASSTEHDHGRTGMRFHATPNVRACELEGELVLLDLARGEYFRLDELGTRAWHYLEAGQSVGEIARRLVSAYDVELDTVVRDLVIFVRDLESAGLVGVRP